MTDQKQLQAVQNKYENTKIKKIKFEFCKVKFRCGDAIQ